MSHRFLAFAAVVVAAPLAIAAPAQADVKAGVDAWAAGDYETAVGEWREPALAGDADAQFNLGQAYRLGRGVPANLDIALDWFRKASTPREGGIIHRKAADEYGLTLFQTGQRAAALPYVEQAAQRGEPRAQYVLGTAYFNGKLVEKDWVRGYALMSRASAAGIPAAQRSLAQMDNYISEPQKREALAMANAMEADSAMASNDTAFPAATAQPQPVARAVDLPPSQTAGTTFTPGTGGSVGAMASADSFPPNRPTEAPVANASPAMAAAQPSAMPAAFSDSASIQQISESIDIPGYTPSAPLRASAPAAAVAVQAAAPIAARSAATGPWRAQIGAFSTEARARAQYDNLGKTIPAVAQAQPYLVDAGRVTRLQIGPFASKAAADRACAAVKRAGNGCFSLKK